MAIISYRNRFVFVKTRKVAGTSVEGVLRTVCGERDVVTPVTAIDEVELYNRGYRARNYAYSDKDETTFNKLIKGGKISRAMKFHREMPKKCKNHSSAVDLRDIVGEQNWQAFLTFTIERHPYSFIASRLSFSSSNYNRGIQPNTESQSLSEALQVVIDDGRLHELGNAAAYRDNAGKVIVDRFIKYENLIEDLRSILEELNLDTGIADNLPEFKSLKRFTIEDAKSAFTDYQLECIYNAHRLTFDTFEYET